MSMLHYSMMATVFIVLRTDFSYHKDLVSYTTALDRCKREGKTTLVIDNESTSRTVREYVGKLSLSASTPIWIGLNLPSWSEEERDYRWSNGLPLSWSSWFGRHEPNQLYSHKCVVLIKGRWLSRDCEDTNSLICQALNAPPTDLPRLDSNHFTGNHFTQVKDVFPSGSVLVHSQKASSKQCASFCLKVESCDVIVWSNVGICQLFSNLTVLEKGSVDESRVYKRKRI